MGGVRRKKRWAELSSRTRKLIIVGASFEAALKVAALIDLARRPAEEIRGSKARWAAAIVFVNSVGALPVVYFAFGRQASPAETDGGHRSRGEGVPTAPGAREAGVWVNWRD